MYNKTTGIYYSMELPIINPDNPSDRLEMGRKGVLIFTIENDSLIRDHINVKMKMNLGFDERIFKDTLFLNAGEKIFTLIESKKYTIPALYKGYILNSCSTTQAVTVNVPGSVQSIVDAQVKVQTVNVPGTIKTEYISVPVVTNAIQTFEFIYNEIDFQFALSQIKSIEDADFLELRLYTENGGISIPIKGYRLKELQNFLNGYTKE